MIAATLVGSTRLDATTFYNVTQYATGENHLGYADSLDTQSPTLHTLETLRHFAGKDVDLSTAIVNLVFLVAGMDHDVEEVIEYTRGMPHMHTDKVETRRGIRCVLISGSVDQWRTATIEGCTAHPLSTARACFNKIYDALEGMGLDLFWGRSRKPMQDGTFLLEKH